MTQFPEHEYLGRSPNWRVRLLHRVAQAVGVLIHIDGLPYGTARNMDFGDRESGCSQSATSN